MSSDQETGSVAFGGLAKGWQDMAKWQKIPGDHVTYRDKSGAWIATYPELACKIPIDRKFRASDIGLDHRILRVLHADKYIKMVGRTMDKNDRHLVSQWEVTNIFKQVMKCHL